MNVWNCKCILWYFPYCLTRFNVNNNITCVLSSIYNSRQRPATCTDDLDN